MNHTAVVDDTDSARVDIFCVGWNESLVLLGDFFEPLIIVLLEPWQSLRVEIFLLFPERDCADLAGRIDRT